MSRSRAVKILSSFERFVLGHSSSGSGPASSSTLSNLAKANEDLSKENQILKRAVQIQNQKLIEKAQIQETLARQQEVELSHFREVVSQQQQQIRQLEMSNYSLAVHLPRAEGGGNGGGGGSMGSRPPDVF